MSTLQGLPSRTPGHLGDVLSECMIAVPLRLGGAEATTCRTWLCTRFLVRKQVSSYPCWCSEDPRCTARGCLRSQPTWWAAQPIKSNRWASFIQQRNQSLHRESGLLLTQRTQKGLQKIEGMDWAQTCWFLILVEQDYGLIEQGIKISQIFLLPGWV